MELYHGSIELVKSPEIREPNRTLDYGGGFYLTSSREQAESWVRRKYASFALYEAGILSKQALIDELKAYKLVNQILLHTEKALKIINFIKAEEVAAI